MTEHPLQVFMEHDPQLMELINESQALELSDGALPKKVKLLIAMALDAAHGAVSGVNALAREAMEAGATHEEILDVVRVVHFICGVGSVYTSARGLKDVFIAHLE
jgi:alkylhydroperoxidase/carboxymuconolactone decarboxylase family protein YurZ